MHGDEVSVESFGATMDRYFGKIGSDSSFDVVAVGVDYYLIHTGGGQYAFSDPVEEGLAGDGTKVLPGHPFGMTLHRDQRGKGQS
jgi:hypothetical protein